MIRNIVNTPGVNKKFLPKFKGPYKIKEVLDYDRYLIGDIEGHQLKQLPLKTIVGADQMKFWIRPI